MRSLPKVTPSNCRLKRCRSNYIAPSENSQECIACPALRSQKWMPTWPERRKRGKPGENGHGYSVTEFIEKMKKGPEDPRLVALYHLGLFQAILEEYREERCSVLLGKIKARLPVDIKMEP